MSKFVPSWDLPDDRGDLYVQCKEAVYARPKEGETESSGVNFKDATVRDKQKSDVASGDLYMKWPGNEDDLTNPFRISQNDKGFWKAYPIDGQPILHVGAAPPPKENKPWTGGRGGGGSSLSMSQQDILYERAWDSALLFLCDKTGFEDPDSEAFLAVVHTKFIGYCRASDAADASLGGQEETPPPGPEPVDDSDIPF